VISNEKEGKRTWKGCKGIGIEKGQAMFGENS